MQNKMLVLVLSLLAAATMGATVYKWVDEKGVTHYAETPPQKQKAQEIQTPVDPAPDAAGGKSGARDWQAQELEFRKRQVERREAARNQEEKEATARREALARKQRCILARQNLHILEKEKRVYSINEKGEPVFINDQTRAAEIARMRMEIESFCEPQ